jgi:hypothetical protein
MEDLNEALINIRNYKGGHKEVDLNEIFNVNEDDLTREFAQQASTYAYFASLCALAEHSAAVAEAKKEQEYSLADLAIRKKFEHNGQKSTEAQIRSSVLADVKYSKAAGTAMDAEGDYKMLKAVVRALEQRAEMLISLGAHLRAEMSQTGMNIREKGYQDVVDEAKTAILNRRGKSA